MMPTTLPPEPLETETLERQPHEFIPGVKLWGQRLRRSATSRSITTFIGLRLERAIGHYGRKVNMPSEKDIVEEARALLTICTQTPSGKITNGADAYLFSTQGPRLLRALVDEVEHARRALKGTVELWDVNNPDDRCGCVGASDDCKYPPPCELCVARLIMEGRTKELFE